MPTSNTPHKPKATALNSFPIRHHGAHIYDRNGYLLADNKPVFTAMLSPDEVEDPGRTLRLLAPIFDLSAEDITDILARIEDNKKNDPVTVKIDLTEQQVAQFSERKPFFRGISIQNKLTRHYPYGELFAHAIGYVGRINDKESKQIDEERYAGTDLIGKIGIEKYYEDLLLGKPGYQSVETNVHGDILRQLNSTPPTAGNDIYLSLDYGLQTVAQEQLAGRRGAIVAIDPQNGDVLAFVSNPSFDPNPFISGISFDEYGMLRDDLDQPLYNRALQGMYPPGSTIKPFASMAGIHYGRCNGISTIYDPGYFTLPGDSHKFRDWKRGGHGTVDLTKSIVESVDTYYYKLSYELGIQKWHDWMVRFGFGSPTGIEFAKRKGGIMPSPQWKKDTYDKDWLPGETISVSIGQGYFLATPLQIAQATAITANKGNIIKPHILKRSVGAVDVTPVDRPTGKVDYNGDAGDWLKMHDAMEQTVKRGTARGIYTQKYRMAGKTGTAQVKSIAQGKNATTKLSSMNGIGIMRGLMVLPPSIIRKLPWLSWSKTEAEAVKLPHRLGERCLIIGWYNALKTQFCPRTRRKCLKSKPKNKPKKNVKSKPINCKRCLEAGEITEAELAERQAELNGETAEDTEGDSETLTNTTTDTTGTNSPISNNND